MEWECILRFSNNKYRLGAGWRDIVNANGLEKNDAVLFSRVCALGGYSPGFYGVVIFKVWSFMDDMLNQVLCYLNSVVLLFYVVFYHTWPRLL